MDFPISFLKHGVVMETRWIVMSFHTASTRYKFMAIFGVPSNFPVE